MNLLRTMRAAYYSAISFIDYQVGRILDALSAEGILDDTLILYTSDHGELPRRLRLLRQAIFS